MKRALAVAALVAAGLAVPHPSTFVAAAPAANGTIKGRTVLAGTPPGNPMIRMGVDPACRAASKNPKPVQEIVVVSPDGGLANVFVKLAGTFPATPVPSGAVVIDQAGCVYAPRVVGARTGQKLRVRNSDRLLHNVHSQSQVNAFNVGQPTAGVANDFVLKAEPGMLRIGCDIHRWMTTYVGVVDHPYFDVSSQEGAFDIENVPAGTYQLQAWHERFGTLTETIRVPSGGTATVTLTFKSGAEKLDSPRGRAR